MMSLKHCLGCVIVLLFSLTGCSKSPDDSFIDREVTGDFGTPFQIQIDNHVRRQPPAVAVQPTKRATHKPTAVFIPLRMRQEISNATNFSNMLSRQIWQIWLSQSIFHTLEFVQTPYPYTPDMALNIAQSKGAELAVGGYIDHYIDGGTGGVSSVSLTIEIYDARSGVQLWSMSQGGMMEARQVHDFYLFAVSERNPGDPSGLITRSLAWDMGRLLMKWIKPASYYKTRKTDDGVLDRTAF